MLRGTRIIQGREARITREVISRLVTYALRRGFQEIVIPAIWEPSTFDKVGNTNSKMMWNFKDKGNRDVCLIPEVTGVIQELWREKKINRYAKNLFYAQRCYRYERPQRGRYREFTQFGIEMLEQHDMGILTKFFTDFINEVIHADYDFNVLRGMDYYIGPGIEASVSNLGTQSQIAGGGIYKEGMGFAVGIDRVVLSIINSE